MVEVASVFTSFVTLFVHGRHGDGSGDREGGNEKQWQVQEGGFCASTGMVLRMMRRCGGGVEGSAKPVATDSEKELHDDG